MKSSLHVKEEGMWLGFRASPATIPTRCRRTRRHFLIRDLGDEATVFIARNGEEHKGRRVVGGSSFVRWKAAPPEAGTWPVDSKVRATPLILGTFVAAVGLEDERETHQRFSFFFFFFLLVAGKSITDEIPIRSGGLCQS